MVETRWARELINNYAHASLAFPRLCMTCPKMIFEWASLVLVALWTEMLFLACKLNVT